VVASFKGVVASDNDQVVIQQLLVDEDIKSAITIHNEKRVKLINKGILERTGKKVNLEPITIKNLTWLVK
jgi:hypothetical protein